MNSKTGYSVIVEVDDYSFIIAKDINLQDAKNRMDEYSSLASPPTILSMEELIMVLKAKSFEIYNIEKHNTLLYNCYSCISDGSYTVGIIEKHLLVRNLE